MKDNLRNQIDKSLHFYQLRHIILAQNLAVIEMELLQKYMYKPYKLEELLNNNSNNSQSENLLVSLGLNLDDCGIIEIFA
jgi:hypothetical protein